MNHDIVRANHYNDLNLNNKNDDSITSVYVNSSSFSPWFSLRPRSKLYSRGGDDSKKSFSNVGDFICKEKELLGSLSPGPESSPPFTRGAGVSAHAAADGSRDQLLSGTVHQKKLRRSIAAIGQRRIMNHQKRE